MTTGGVSERVFGGDRLDKKAAVRRRVVTLGSQQI